MKVDGEMERVCMRWPGGRGRVFHLLEPWGNMWGLGLIGHDMQTFSLERNVVPELWSVWLCL